VIGIILNKWKEKFGYGTNIFLELEGGRKNI